jgi:uncharacterized protein (TIGR02453 family)
MSAFDGFSQQAIDFLENLAANNERAWFEAHKTEYQRYLLEPALAFVDALGSRLQTIADGIRYDKRTDGSGVLMRIYRDTRFSKDKTPYKTNISGLFVEGEKKTESPAFGFQLEATGMGLMVGIFKFPPAMLTAYRDAVVDEKAGGELKKVLDTIREAGQYEIGGAHYKRVPTGYDPKHERADLLRYDGLYAFSPRIQINETQSPALVDICYTHFRKMAPLYHWLVKNTSS